MDSANHNVLQFVSAAAQIFEKQQVEDLRGSAMDLVHSQDNLSTNWITTEETTTDNSLPSHQRDTTASIEHSSQQQQQQTIKELLAEATGIRIETEEERTKAPSSSSSSLKNNTALSSAVNDQTIEEKLQRVFQLPTKEALRGEWPCYIVQSAIVPGFMYLTEGHICFYASLPKNQLALYKSGYLLLKKSAGKTTKKKSQPYERYFFDIKEDTLSWYESPVDAYSPLGKIDLKSTIAIRQSTKRQNAFRIVTMNKTWHLQADTNAALIEWTNSLHKAIFRAKNNGSSLKITLPFENILDMELTEAFEFQKFLKIRAVGIDDKFVMDEYYFAYFTDIVQTFQHLTTTWNSHSQRRETVVSQQERDNQQPLSTSYTNFTEESANTSPSLSISDLYDADSQPITIPAYSTSTLLDETKRTTDVMQRKSSSSSTVANALTVPSVIKDFLSTNKQTASVTTGQTQPEKDSYFLNTISNPIESSSEDEDQPSIGWLDGTRRSGLKLMYGLLRGSKSSGSLSTAIMDSEDDENADDDEEEGYEDGHEETTAAAATTLQIADESEMLDERTMTNFKKYFLLPETESLIAVFRCSLMKTLPCYGKLYISSKYISFNSKGFATKAKIIIPFQDVIRIQKIRSRGYLFHSLSILTQSKKEIYLEFSSITRRNSCFAKLFIQHKRVSEPQTDTEETPNKHSKNLEAKLMEDDLSGTNNIEINTNIPTQTEEAVEKRIIPNNLTTLPILFTRLPNELASTIVYKKPNNSFHFTCITIGTRGDVQPYIALCKGLMKEGHRCRIATHEEFKDWIEEHGIEFRSVGGDPGELMRICVENNFFSVNFVVEGLRLFKYWIDELLELTWKAVQETDIIIESPSAMVGIHMAEALQVPYFRSFPMPMTRTRSFPHPFATPNNPKGRLYNDMTYVLFEHAVWRAIASRTNSFRRTTLGLPSTTYEKLEVWRIPYLYSFSPSIVPSPLDWLDWIHCTGYWFLDNPQTGWVPDAALQSFIEASDSRPIVYIGFGSIIVSDPQEIIRVIVESVLLSNVRAIVSQGWSSRLRDKSQQKTKDDDENQDILKRYPDTIFSVESVPHDWLFPRIRAVVHHGGAGTTAAGLRAGRPTIIKPFFADQFFWGERVEEMGLGKCIKQLTVENLSAALRVVSTDENMLRMANQVGRKIRAETGVETAIQCIYRDLELAKARTMSSIQKTAKADYLSSKGGKEGEEDQDWTIIEGSASGSISPGSWKPST